MPGILDHVQNWLKALKEIVGLTVQIWHVVRRNRALFTGLAIACSAYVALSYYAFYRPASTIRSFYKAVEAKHAGDIAWDLIYVPYRDEKWPAGLTTSGSTTTVVTGVGSFTNGFRTTVAYSDMSIVYHGRTWNPADLVRALSGEPLEYDVSFTVLDRFTKDDFLAPEQQYDLLWLHIAHFKVYDLLRDGRLPLSESGFNYALELTRSYRKRIELRRESKWLISHIDTYEEALSRNNQQKE